jgi:hypothetical protein
MDSFGVKPLPKFRYPEVVHSSLKHTYSIFLHAKVFEMHQNTPKHHFSSSGVAWMHFVRNHYRIFGNPN